ncbi:MAG: hypothetical protein OHK0012_26840 [Synechococcales cyanobacterium]
MQGLELSVPLIPKTELASTTLDIFQPEYWVVWTHHTLGAIAKSKSNTPVTLDPESLPPGEHTLTVSAYSPLDFAMSNPLGEQSVTLSVTAPVDPQNCRRFIRPNGKNAYALIPGVSCYFNGDYLYVIDPQRRFNSVRQSFIYQEQAPDYYTTRYERVSYVDNGIAYPLCLGAANSIGRTGPYPCLNPVPSPQKPLRDSLNCIEHYVQTGDIELLSGGGEQCRKVDPRRVQTLPSIHYKGGPWWTRMDCDTKEILLYTHPRARCTLLETTNGSSECNLMVRATGNIWVKTGYCVSPVD